MSTVMLTQSDLRVRDSVLHELLWDSQIDASAIGVTARNGAVTLTGFIDAYSGKLAAERAAKRVRGVRAVANDIQVRLRLERTDPEIAGDAARLLNARVTLPEKVQAVVHGGHVTLTGSVPTLFQRAIAERAMHDIRGIKSVVNRMEVEPIAAPRDVQRELVRALHRDADINARGIDVTVTGNRVRLTGTVGSWHEREAAEQAASHATGIAVVDNQIGVRLDEGPSADSYEPC